jgi:FtsP/CotA-like multicopper oxidase with cupredoxin domain
VVSFNARLYCYRDRNQAEEVVCSFPGPTIIQTPGDNLTLVLINELHGGSSAECKSVFE